MCPLITYESLVKMTHVDEIYSVYPPKSDDLPPKSALFTPPKKGQNPPQNASNYTPPPPLIKKFFQPNHVGLFVVLAKNGCPPSPPFPFRP